MRLIFFFFILLSCQSSKRTTQTVNNCYDSFYVQYRCESKIKSYREIYLEFEYGFNDTLEIFLNGNLIKRRFYKTDPSLGLAGYIKLITPKANNFIRIINVTQGRCLEFFVDPRYQRILIDFGEKKWGVSFSNCTTNIE